MKQFHNSSIIIKNVIITYEYLTFNGYVIAIAISSVIKIKVNFIVNFLQP